VWLVVWRQSIVTAASIDHEKRGEEVELGRLSSGERIASVSAILLFVCMFFDWFGVESSDDSFSLFSVGHSAWEALDYIPFVLLITIIVTLAVAVLRFKRVVLELPVSINAVVAILGVVSVLLIFFRIVDPPSFGSFGTAFGTVSAEGTVELGVVLALLAAAGIAFGSYRGMREEGVRISVSRARRRRG
jgi:magnesium-transporting ATPase (P-type)